MLLGLISDTHGLLRPHAVKALQGSDLIIHAGDVGRQEILQTLAEIAPVKAVRGNVDKSDWAAVLPHTQVINTDETILYVIHDLNEMRLDPAAAGFQIVISGHSHKPGSHKRDGLLYINPGSAGPRRFKLPITVARLDLEKKPWSPQFIELQND